MIVSLEPWEWVHALNVAARRQEANWDSSDRAHYDRKRMEDDRTAQARACVCELAVAKATNRYWSGSVWAKSKHSKYKNSHADVGTNFEVRCVRSRDDVAVREWQVGQGLHLFAARTTDAELTQVEIIGHMKYDDAWELGTTPNYIKHEEAPGKRTRSVLLSDLHPFPENYTDNRSIG